MRHIDLSQLYLPSEWFEHTTELVKELSQMTAEERSKALSKENYTLWRLLRKMLERISHGKCFYSDVESFGANGEIDHFRPKLGVEAMDLAPGTTNEGYWFLAYLIDNLRFSSQWSNRKETIGGITYGKGTRFPLLDPSKRAAFAADLCNEKPLLLNPTSEEDVALLGFNDAGEPEPSFAAKTDLDKKRVEISIQVYRLGGQQINKKRGDLCLRAMELARKLDELEEEKPWDNNNRRKVIKTKIELYEMLQPQAEFSSAVRYVLQQFSDLPSVQEVLSHSIN